MAELSPSIQLEILNEVGVKSDGITPIEIDCTDPDRNLNFRELQSNDCFVFFAGDEKMKVDFEYVSLRPNMKRSLAGLSMKGHKRRLELTAQFTEERRQQEHDELTRRQTVAFELTAQKAEEANKIARWANWWSISALVVSGISMLTAVGALLVSLFR